MNCPHCASTSTSEQAQKTTLDYRTFRCLACKRRFNERTGTPFNFLEYPTDVVLLVVLWRLRYKLSLRDLAEMFLARGIDLNNRLEQDHRGVKQRYYPMRGFGNFASAARFCHAFDELRNYFRPRHTMGETRSLLEQRQLFCEKLATLQLLMRMAS